jgi:hypothetical protein
MLLKETRQVGQDLNSVRAQMVLDAFDILSLCFSIQPKQGKEP